MNPYKKWSGPFREKSLKLTNKAKALGWIKELMACSICYSSDKKTVFHNNDYDATYYTLKEVFTRNPVTITEEEKKKINDALISVCRSCHTKIHKEERASIAG